MSAELGRLQEQTFARATPATVGAYPASRRLTGQQLADYLDRRAFAVISSTRPDGRPHAAMSSYVRRAGTFWLPTGPGSVRERNVRARPWLSMVVTEGDRGQHVFVRIEGRGSVVTPSEVPADVRAAVPGEWVNCWIRLEGKSVLSYSAAEPSR